MRIQTKTKRKQGIALLLCLCMIFSSSATVFAAKTPGTQGHVADGDTRYTYTRYLNDSGDAGELTTEYSGRVWADKTVTTEDITFSGGDVGTVTVQNDSDFLVVYSALANTQKIVGQQQAPVDVVFVIDLSGSMITSSMGGRNRLSHAIDALNDSIKTLMDANPYNRVGVVGYNNTAITFLNLGRYTADGGKYFSYATDKTQTESTTLLRVACHAKESKLTSSHNIWGQYATNTQMGLYAGMSLLANEATTTAAIDGRRVRRIPALVHLSDGNPTVSSDSTKWWSPENNFEDGRGATSVTEAGNGMKALMTGAYMKQQVNRNYNADGNSSYNLKVYTIGMGLEQISVDGGNAQHLANITLNPEKYLSESNPIAKEINTAWRKYSGNQKVKFSFKTYPYTGIISDKVDANGLGSTTGKWRSGWTSTNPYPHEYTFRHPNNDDISSLLYVDQYFPAEKADDVTEVFGNIVSDIITSSPDVPTEEDPRNPSESGYITYTDVIGDYMEVKDVKTLIFMGENCGTPTKEVDGTVTTYTFNREVASPVYGEHNASDIKIEVLSNTDTITGKMIQTMTVKIPASSIPLRVNTVNLDRQGNVKSHTTNGAYPLRLCYTVGVQESVLTDSDGDGAADLVDLDKIDDAYENSHKDADGNLYLYSNLYTGTEKCESGYTAGDAHVMFTPAKSNPYFYVQEPVALYTDAACKKQLREAPTDNGTYYYKVTYYEGKNSVTDIRSVIGIKGAVEKVGEYYFVKAGEMNVPHTESKHEYKGEAHRTQTADLYNYMHMGNEGIAYVQLGNNGRLTMKVRQKTGELTISKVVSGDADAKNRDWLFTVTLKNEADKPLTGSYSYTGGTVTGMTGITPPANGTLTPDKDGKAAIRLKHGQTITLSLPVGTKYEVTEQTAEGYQTSSTGEVGTIKEGQEDVAAFTNTQLISIAGEKIWDDDGDRDGKRPESITIWLYADGVKLSEKMLTVTEQDGWRWCFTDLPKYNDGNEIIYTISEDVVKDYSSEVNGYNITNSYTPSKTSITVIKAWDDDYNRDGLRPSSITVKLIADGVDTGQTLTLSAENNWTGTFANLPEYVNNKDAGQTPSPDEGNAGGADEEQPLPTDSEEAQTGAPESSEETVSGSNAGQTLSPDEGNAGGAVEEQSLTSDSEEAQTGLLESSEETVSGSDAGQIPSMGEENNGTDVLVNLPENRSSKKIVYSIEEVSVSGYETVSTGDASGGFVITNKHTPETIDLSGFKIWEDNNNQDGKRPEAITIRLHADGAEMRVATVTANDGWKWSFTNLPKYAKGKEISYTITEDEIPGYQAEIDGMNVINRYTPGKINIPVTKFWQDENNAASRRPDSITVKLYADGEETGKELVLSKENNWTGNFDSLDEYAAGEKIVYTIAEVKVDGYTTTISGDTGNGFVITNTYTPDKPERDPEPDPDPNPPDKPNEPDPPNPSQHRIKDTPETGDRTRLMLWIVLLAVSGTGLGAMLVYTVKRRHKRYKGKDLK